ncbi:MAG: tetratricopeptide repeat protein [Bacteroidales bacterium]
MKQHLIWLILFAGFMFRQTDLVAEPANSFSIDTNTIHALNDQAYEYYYVSNLDSCYYYALKALNLTDSLLQLESVKSNPQYLNRCRILKARSLTNIGRSFSNKDLERAKDTLLSALEIVGKTGNEQEEVNIYATIGNILSFNSRYKAALEYYLKALELSRKLGNRASYAEQLTNVSITQRYTGNYGESLAHLMEALKISEELKDTANIIEIYLAMGFVYILVEQWDEALKSQEKTLEIYKLINDSTGIARIYNDMGVTEMWSGNLDKALELHRAALKIRLNTSEIYSTFASYSYIGRILEEKGDYKAAVDNYEKGLHYAQIAGFKIGIADARLNLGEIYLKLPDTGKAMQQFNKVWDISHDVQDGTGEVRSAIQLASVYLNRDQHRQALNWLQKAENAASRAPLIYVKEIYRKIAESYFQLGDFENAYLNRVKYDEVKDSVAVSENMERITRLTNKLEFENKIALQKESNEKMMALQQVKINRERLTRNIFLLGMLLAVGLVIIIFVRFMEKKKLNRRLNETLDNLRATQSQLVHAEKMASLGELTAGIAHEIQNPLNFVNNFSEVSKDLLEELAEAIQKGDTEEIQAISDDLKQNLDKINQHGKRAEGIVKGMLQHSRSRSGQKEAVDINKLADEYLRLAYHGLRAKDKSFNADFKLEADEDLPEVNLVAQDIGRVMLNLINNAFFSVSEKTKQSIIGYKPVVIVKTRKLNQQIEIRVNDNGTGIPEEIRAKIFQPFFTTKPTGQGTGLGLSMSYDIITKGHGGKISVESKVGEGSEFIITLNENK